MKAVIRAGVAALEKKRRAAHPTSQSGFEPVHSLGDVDLLLSKMTEPNVSDDE